MSFTFDYISHALTSVVWTHKVKKALNSGNTIAAIFKSILPPPAYLQIQGNGLSLTVMTKRYYSDTRPLKAFFDTLFTFLVSSGQEEPWNCHKSWKVLSQNFLFLELKSPGKFCLAEKIVLEFSQNNFNKNGHSGIFSPGIFRSWNLF